MNNKNIKSKFPVKYIPKSNSTLINSYRKSRLSSGLVVVTEELQYVESFSMGVFVNGGSRLDMPEKTGTAHFIEHLIFRSSSFSSQKRISSMFDEIGAYVNAYTTKEYTSFHIRALKNHFKKAAGLLCNIISNCEFRSSNVEKERKIILEEIKLYQDDPDEIIFDAAEKLLYGNHPLGNPITGTKDTLHNININVLDKYYSDYYTPDNITISITGNITHNNAIDFLETLFNGNSSVRIRKRFVKPELNTGKELFLKKQVEQAYIMLSCPSPSFDSEDKFALLVLDVIFCSGMSSRLQSKLREKNCIAYYIESEPIFYSDNGAYYITLVVDKSNIAQALNLVYREISELKSSHYFNTELLRAKEQLKSSLIIDFENLSSRMRSNYCDEYYYGKHHNVSDILKQIDAVTKEQITQVINKYFAVNRWNKIILESE